MAEQKGLILIRGKLGKQIFYSANGKQLVKNVSDKPHKLSENSKKTAAEFSKLTKVASLINSLFKQYFYDYRDSKVYFRLNKLLPKITSAITNQLKGDRIFSTGKLSLLKGFQLNAATSTQKLLSLTPKFTLLPKKQQIIIEMPELHTSSFTVPDHAEK